MASLQKGRSAVPGAKSNKQWQPVTEGLTIKDDCMPWVCSFFVDQRDGGEDKRDQLYKGSERQRLITVSDKSEYIKERKGFNTD